MRDFVRRTLLVAVPTSKMTRWVGPLPGIAEGDEWPPHCLPIGREGDLCPTGNVVAEDHDGSTLEITALPNAEIMIGVKITRPMLPFSPTDPKPRVRVAKFEAPEWGGQGWEVLGEFDIPTIGNGATIAITWRGGDGAIAVEPLPGEWCAIPGQYVIEFDASGARLKKRGALQSSEGLGVVPDVEMNGVVLE